MNQFQVLRLSFRRSLLAENKSPNTVEIYLSALDRFGDYLLSSNSLPDDIRSIKRLHVEGFICYLLECRKPATAHNRYRCLQAFFKWLVQEGEIEVSPMLNMKPPRVPDESPAVLTDDVLIRLLKTCQGKSFDARRDTGIIRLLMDTGMRRTECANLKVEDVDLDSNVAYVVGKGRRPRVCPFGRKTAMALDRYLRVRGQHRLADQSKLWVGRNGPMTPSGIYQVVRDRAREAGLGDVKTHQLRHTFAHLWLANGGQEET